jgi:magnesium chelatase subunit I
MNLTEIAKLGDLRLHMPHLKTVREELRDNVVRLIAEKKDPFTDIKGYGDTVIPQIINALICGHHIIFLGERGQGKTRLIRDLIFCLDEFIPAIAGCPIHDNPYEPVCTDCKNRVGEEGDNLEIDWIPRDKRLVEKLATSDVSTADLIGEVDPIRIAQGRTLDDESAIHFGLVPRAHRGIFAINELPDLAEKIQVSLFNIMEESDLQIKGFPLRLPLDILLVATANPEDYTSRGRIITPLKDRFDTQIKTHYPLERAAEIEIMDQEVRNITISEVTVSVPSFIKNILAEITMQARSSPDVNQHSGVSCRVTIRSFEALMGNALRRCLTLNENRVVPRITDIDATFPTIMGKLELEYGGQDRNVIDIIEDLVRRAIKVVFDEHFTTEGLATIVESFNRGLGAEVSHCIPSEEYMDGLKNVPGLYDAVKSLVNPEEPGEAASAIEFILEGLHLSNKLNRKVSDGTRTYNEHHPEPPESSFKEAIKT